MKPSHYLVGTCTLTSILVMLLSSTFFAEEPPKNSNAGGVAAKKNTTTSTSANVATSSNFANAVEQDAYNAKMRAVITDASKLAPDATNEFAANATLFIEAIHKYNRMPNFQKLLAALPEKVLMRYASFVNGSTHGDDSELRVVNSLHEMQWRALMVTGGVVPKTDTIRSPEYEQHFQESLKMQERQGQR